MRSVLIALVLILVACAGTAGETTLQCADCPVALVVRSIAGDTLDTSMGRVRLFGLTPWSVGNGAHQKLQTGYGNSPVIRSGLKMDRGSQIGTVGVLPTSTLRTVSASTLL